jgi:predicted small lipoprotein YifL
MGDANLATGDATLATCGILDTPLAIPPPAKNVAASDKPWLAL